MSILWTVSLGEFFSTMCTVSLHREAFLSPTRFLLYCLCIYYLDDAGFWALSSITCDGERLI